MKQKNAQKLVGRARRYRRPRAARKDYDLELAVLDAIRPHPAFTFTGCELAGICGVSRQRIYQITRSGLGKIRDAVLPLITRDDLRMSPH